MILKRECMIKHEYTGLLKISCDPGFSEKVLIIRKSY